MSTVFTFLAPLIFACSDDRPSPDGGEACPEGAAVDADGDGYPASPSGDCGDTEQALDCDDSDSGVSPAADERCDGVDNDCDGVVDEDAQDAATWYADADADGHGDPDSAEVACDAPAGTVAEGDDYDDADPELWESDGKGACLETGDDTGDDTGDPDDTGQAPDPAVCGDDDLPAATTDDGRGWGSVADAIAAASDGGTVDVCEGTHAEELEIEAGTTLTLRSHNGDPTTTMFSGEGSWRILSVGSGATVTVQDLGFVNGYGPMITATSSQGAAIYAPDATLTVTGSVFSDNASETSGGAIYTGGGDLILRDTEFSSNDAETFGGALFLQPGAEDSVLVEGCTFASNSVMINGAAAVRIEGEGEVEISGSSFTENQAYSEAVLSIEPSLWGSMAVQILDSSFDSNWSIESTAVLGVSGRGAFTLDIVGCDITDNTAGYKAGVLSLTLWEDATLRIEDTTITGNDENSKGTIHLGGFSRILDVSIIDSVLDGNSTGDDASVILSDGVYDLATIEIQDTSIAANDGAPALVIGDYTVLSCTNVDFGTDSSDNQPSDLDFRGTTYDDLGAGETFLCEADGECAW